MPVHAKTKATQLASKVGFAMVFLCALFATACTVPTRVILFNGTSQDIDLLYRDMSGDFTESNVKAKFMIEIAGLLSARFSIRTQSHNYEYIREVVPESFITHVGIGPFFKRVAKAQLENDWCIYLVDASTELPAESFPIQPPGYPLCPNNS